MTGYVLVAVWLLWWPLWWRRHYRRQAQWRLSSVLRHPHLPDRCGCGRYGLVFAVADGTGVHRDGVCSDVDW